MTTQKLDNFEPILDTKANIIDPQSQRWHLVQGDGIISGVYVLDPTKASPSELQYYKFRATAHKNGLTEQEFMMALKRGEFPEYAHLRAQAGSFSRSERAAFTPFSSVEDLVANRFAGFGAEDVHEQVLLRRLDSCGLSRSGSHNDRWARLKAHVYKQVAPEFLRFCLLRAGRPLSTLEGLSKRELFNQWNDVSLASHDVDPQLLLDAWHHADNFTTDSKDVSDMALNLSSDHFETLVQSNLNLNPKQNNDDNDNNDNNDNLNQSDFAKGVQHALRPEYLKAVTMFHGFDVGDDFEYQKLLETARSFDKNPPIQLELTSQNEPHWETVVAKCRRQDTAGALFSAGVTGVTGITGATEDGGETHDESDLTNVSLLKRKLRHANRTGCLDFLPPGEFDTLINSF
jgi:hypothetical protein